MFIWLGRQLSYMKENTIMKLSKLLEGVEYEILQGNADTDISAIEYDSRKVRPDSLFVCMSGFASDGHGYISRAYELGAKAVIVEKSLKECHEALEKKAQEDGFGGTYVPLNMTVVKVDNSRKALALISATWFGHPAEKLTMIGLTGTKGKTTTTHMIKSIIEASGHKVGMIGTIGSVIDGEKIPTKNTTPESYELHSLFDTMVKKGCKYCVMEVSSQAFKLFRTYGIEFDYGAFLNISPDHIGPGEHENFEEYLEYKKQIFKQSKTAVVNIDDEHVGKLYKEGIPCEKVLSISTRKEASLYCDKIEDIWEPGLLGTRMHVKGTMEDNFVISMPGRFNVENALVATVICNDCGISKRAIEDGLKKTSVKGRTQLIKEASHIATFIIDYAHNALSMESLLSMLKGYAPKKLICVFGGGGNKPKQRRYDMGAAAGKYADLTILTEDNPRYEEIENINKDIIVGLDAYKGKYEIILDRKKAIEYTIDTAEPGYIVAFIGKGHETYQDVKGVKTYFCEEEIIKEYVQNKKALS